MNHFKTILCKCAFVIVMMYNLLLYALWIQRDDNTNNFHLEPLSNNRHASGVNWWPVSNTQPPMPFLNWHDLLPSSNEQGLITKLIDTSTTPSFTICVYPPERDKFVSAALLSEGIWEPHITPLFQKGLRSYPNATVLDIGANIGYYTLLSAKMGHQVIAVEPSQNNLDRLHQAAIRDNEVAAHIKIVRNAITNFREQVILTSSDDNQGGLWVKPLLNNHNITKYMSSVISTVLLDDLDIIIDRKMREYSNNTIILKVDIEGFECRAFAGAKRLLTSHYIPYIFMEWGKMFLSRHRPTSPCPVRALHKLTELMTQLGYQAYEVHTGVLLDPDRSTKSWRIGDLYWRHRMAMELHIPS